MGAIGHADLVAGQKRRRDVAGKGEFRKGCERAKASATILEDSA